MTGPDRPSAPTPTAHWRGGWAALLATVGARAILTALAGLVLVALLPLVLGWHSTVVMTGSMQPRLHPGDVVLSRPIATDRLQLGQVLLVDDPDHPGRLRLHRLAAFRPDGRLTLRGDANRATDSTPVSRSAVKGVGSLRAPYVGLPFVWLHDRDYLPLLLTGAGLLVLFGAAFGYRPDEPHGPPPPGRSRSRTTLRFRRPIQVGAALAVVAAAGVITAGPAQGATPFNATAVNPKSSWAASTFFTCTNAVTAADPSLYYKLNETSGKTAADSSGNANTGTYQGTVTQGVAGPCLRDSGNTAVTLNGSTGWVSTSTLISAAPNTFTEEIWFKTTTSQGGKLIGFSDARTGGGTAYDRHLYMTNSGQLVFGVTNLLGLAKTVITSPGTYRDGAWHLADASLSSTGMVLYVDGQQVASNASVTSGQTYVTGGYWRFGYGLLTGWPSAPTSSYFGGSIGQAAVYPTALSAAQVAAHYAAAS